MMHSMFQAIGLLVVFGATLSAAQAPEPANFPEFQVGYNASAISTTNLSYTDGTAPLRGFLAYDNTTTETRPGVVIFPDYDGIGPYEMWRAKLLAQLGYTAFVADVYSQQVVQGPSMPLAQRTQLTQAFAKNPDLWAARLQAGLAELRDQPTVDPERLAAYGYCFGGGGTIQLMYSYPNNTEGLLGVVGFHPSIPTQTADQLEYNNPIKGLFFLGYVDPGAPPATVAAFESTLNATNATWTMVELGQTAHAFTEPNIPVEMTNDPSTSQGYNPESDVFSWWAARGFLRDLFGATAQSSNPYTETVAAGIEVA